MIKLFRQLNNKNGFTLIEVVCSLILMGFVSSIIGMGISQAVETYIIISDSAEGLQKGQFAMSRLVKEFRGITELKTITDNEITFISQGKEKYLKKDGGSLFFDDDTTDDDPVKLIDGIGSFSLTYFSVFDGPAVLNINDANIIEISLKLKGIESFEFKDRVFLREKI